MRETELKAVVPNQSECEERLAQTGARLTLAGRIEDARYDTEDHSLFRRGHMLRLRVTRVPGDSWGTLDFKGPASYEGGYKHREETSVRTPDIEGLKLILYALGLRVSLEIEREVRAFMLDGATIRFERFPRMDTLVEVEGMPESIERAITTLGIPRPSFTAERLSAFVARFEARTGQRAAVSDRELRGEYLFSLDNA